MNAPDSTHNLRPHAVLSASSADRWLSCPPSARLTENVADERSEHALYGTQMHELAERCLISGRDAATMTGTWDKEQRDAVQVYLDYVRSITGELMIEQRLSFEKWVQEGFGTCDAIVISDGHMTVADLKGGKGVRVDAEDNSQLKLYALAAFDAYEAIYGPILKIKLVIVQPRLDHIDEWEIHTSDLLDWADNVVRPIAALAWEGKGEAKSGEHCQFCRIRHTCRTRAETNLALAKDEMGEWTPPAANLTDADLAGIYPRLTELIKWANDLRGHCLARAEQGVKFPGLKLVEGRSDRYIADPVLAKHVLNSAGYGDEKILRPTELITLTGLEKLVGKKEFANLLADCITKPAGNPVLVPATDKRPEITSHTDAVREMTSLSHA